MWYSYKKNDQVNNDLLEPTLVDTQIDNNVENVIENVRLLNNHETIKITITTDNEKPGTENSGGGVEPPVVKADICDSLARRVPAFGLLLVFGFQFLLYTTTCLIYKYPLTPAINQRVTLAYRCLTGTLSFSVLYIAYRLMPLADATTLRFTTPVFVAVFAYFILGDKLTMVQLGTGVCTLAGVVVIAKPVFLFGEEDGNGAEPAKHENRILGTLLATLSAASAAMTAIMLRRLKGTPVAVVIVWYSATRLTVPEGWLAWTLLAGVGACGACEQFFITNALRYESPSPVCIVRTFTIVLSFMWEVTLLREPIEWTSVLGACMCSSCVVVLALFKWRQESPDLFANMWQRLTCGPTGAKGSDTDADQ
ncbi:unnamed protein product [Medioppia subpectinata]|uniref:EamA domain-containing protein n=1 Tax=Medioppia subpectinata TaxID=1979941 RepID=A0A7R9PTE1_9ACAR|nr:unnamed protein product [Medioppia subpectinata]CAG2100411.1 unnamed protein product [Medioppia subpectinata]